MCSFDEKLDERLDMRRGEDAVEPVIWAVDLVQPAWSDTRRHCGAHELIIKSPCVGELDEATTVVGWHVGVARRMSGQHGRRREIRDKMAVRERCQRGAQNAEQRRIRAMI